MTSHSLRDEVVYEVGGLEIFQARQDVEEGKAMGLDAFALNVLSTECWSTDTIARLFEAALDWGFRLFFSFDMMHFSHPSQFIPLLKQYCVHDAYFSYDGLPFVSTFWGATLSLGHPTPNEAWQREYRDALRADGVETYFVPAFSHTESGPHDFFEKFPVVDGVMNWESWPWASEGKTSVASETDEHYLRGARRAGKTVMMSISSHQFKHMAPNQNWYRRGELNLAARIPQILSLQPDFLQIQTWNDAGESHYIGNCWPNTIMHDSVRKYTDNFDHSGWRILLKSLIVAYKNGSDILRPTAPRNAEGAFWYRTIFTHSPCAADPLGKPENWDTAEDVVSVAVVLSREAEKAVINVYSDGAMVGSKKGKEGLNAFTAPMKAGAQKVEVVDTRGNVIVSATGTQLVVTDSDFQNYNYVVVALEPVEGSAIVRE